MLKYTLRPIARTFSTSFTVYYPPIRFQWRNLPCDRGEGATAPSRPLCQEYCWALQPYDCISGEKTVSRIFVLFGYFFGGFYTQTNFTPQKFVNMNFRYVFTSQTDFFLGGGVKSPTFFLPWIRPCLETCFCFSFNIFFLKLIGRFKKQ